MKRTSSIFLISLLVLSSVLLLIPTGVVHASTGHARLAHVAGAAPTFTTVTDATFNESVVAGTSLTTYADGVALPSGNNTFAIDFSSLPGVTFSGTQFELYMSRNGFSSLTTTGASPDVQYGPTFNIAEFAYNCAVACDVVPGSVPGVGTVNFYVGNIGGVDIVAGPIALDINSSFNYIKIFDGSTGAVAVTLGLLFPQPGISVTPSSGPAGTSVTVSGGAFPSGMSVDINATYSTAPWIGTSNTTTTITFISGIATGNGYFTQGATMLDVQQVINTKSLGVITTVPILLFAVNASHLSTIINSQQYAIPSPYFSEYSRGIASISSYDNAGTFVGQDAFVANRLYGNDTGMTGTVGTTSVVNPGIVPAKVFGTLYIAGNNSKVGASVTFLVGGPDATVAQSTPMTSVPATASVSGFWNTTATVPVLGNGFHNVWVDMGGVYYNFTIDVLPTLIISPTSGTSSNPETTVSVTAYGFPNNNVIYIFWGHETLNDGYFYNLANGTVGTNGEFTSVVTFTVPDPTYGGPHPVYALDNSSYTFAGSPVTGFGESPIFAETTFTVLPSLLVVPSSVNANTQGFISAYAEGLSPSTSYRVQIDGSLFNVLTIPSRTGFNGNALINFTASGFRPGLHQIELTVGGILAIEGETPSIPYGNVSSPATWAYFNVTTTNDYIYGGFASLSSAMSGVTTAVNGLSTTLTNIQNSLTTITGDITSLQGSVSSLSSTLATDYNTLNTGITGISTSLSSISSNLNTAVTQATNAANSASQAASEASTAASNTSGLSNVTTYILVVAVLAAITVVLELAVLVRKLS